MNRGQLFCRAGYLLFGIAILNNIFQYGERWTISSEGYPKTILSSDKQHYPDGVPVDPVTLQIVKPGLAEHIWNWFLMYLVIMFVAHVYVIRNLRNSQERLVALREFHLSLNEELGD